MRSLLLFPFLSQLLSLQSLITPSTVVSAGLPSFGFDFVSGVDRRVDRSQYIESPSKMLKQSASLYCSFGLFGLFGLSGLSRVFGLSG